MVRAMALANIFPSSKTAPREIGDLLRRLRPIDVPLTRLGPEGDGGYLVPDDLDGIVGCFSPGVSGVSGFERACADRGMAVYLADASVAGPAEAHANFHFSPTYIGLLTEGRFITLEDWVNAAQDLPAGDLMLQMDIEGFEYESLLGLSMSLQRRFRIIVVEFHDLHHLWNAKYFGLAARVFDKLLSTHHCVHIHPNNTRPSVSIDGYAIPPLMEFTFVRRDRSHGGAYATRFPHPLDRDCSSRPHCALPPCWYQQSYRLTQSQLLRSCAVRRLW